MKRVILSSHSKEYYDNHYLRINQALWDLLEAASSIQRDTEDSRNEEYGVVTKIKNLCWEAQKELEKIDRFMQPSEVVSSTEITAAEDDDYAKGYFDEYYGKTAYEEYGDLVSRECSGMVISKRADEGEEPGGLIYEAERLGIDDFFDLLKCLEGMCYNRKAVEISDYQYKVL